MSKRPTLAPVHSTAALDMALRMRCWPISSAFCARLCQQIAIDSSDEHVADEFSQLASEFMEVAEQIEGGYGFGVPRHRLH